MTMPKKGSFLLSVTSLGLGAFASAGVIFWALNGDDARAVEPATVVQTAPQYVAPQATPERTVAQDTFAALVAETYAARDAASRAESMLATTQSQLAELKALLKAGIDAEPQAEATPIAAVAEIEAPVPVTDTCIDKMRYAAPAMTVYFDPGSATLNEVGLLNVRAFGQMLSACSDVIVHATGHSDASGDEQTNLNLSWQRADNVVAALETLGFDTSHVDAVGFGIRLPSAQGDTDGDRDRRVEFHILEMH